MTRFAALKADIDHELRNLKRLAKELDDILTATKEGSIARTRAVGSLLHDFYTGVEKIFSQIAMTASSFCRIFRNHSPVHPKGQRL